MRKILLATTALAGLAAFAPMAQAQTKDSPLDVNIGGYVDFRAGVYDSSDDTRAAQAFSDSRHHDFETEYKFNIDVSGKAAHGIEYGGRLSVWNGPAYGGAHGTTGLRTADTYVYLAGAYGKVVGGDHNGAVDLFVYAPTVGAGQVDGRYTEFLNPAVITAFTPSFIENGNEYSTKATYLTPQVEINEDHKVQLAVSYAPNFYNGGQSVIWGTSTTVGAAPSYRNLIKAAGQYQGNFDPVNVVFSAVMHTANSDGTMGVTTTSGNNNLVDFTSWGLGGQAGYAGFTIGGSYVDGGKFLTVNGQNKDQHTWTAGVKYEMDKIAAAFSYLSGAGYNNGFVAGLQGAAGTNASQNYVKSFDAYAVGATYTWFPGMATQLDIVHVQQERDDAVNPKNAAHVAVLTQKLTF